MSLDAGARRLLRRVPRTTVYSAMELLLLTLLAVQCARLFWTLVTPAGPVGEWKASSALRPPMPTSTSLLGSFDPFFRVSGASNAPAVVTSLNLKLYGVREDRASGRGSAIIGLPDGQQRSFAVGEEVVPGVTLTGVSFDGVTISRGGAPEQLFLDQSRAPGSVSGAAPPVGTAPAPGLNFGTPAPPPAPPPPAAATPNSPEFQVQPRLSGGAVTGLTVQPQGSGNAFRAAGFAPGDVITSVNGQRVTSAEQARSLAIGAAGGEVNVEVDRAGRRVPLKLKGGQ
jgi:general secretion pathway protein C